jgi:PAS domain S-box-containing protein
MIRESANDLIERDAGGGDVSAPPPIDLQPAIFTAALASISQGVLIADHERRIVYLNESFTALTGYSAADMVGRSCAMMQGAQTDPATVAAIHETLARGDGFSGEILNYKKSGEAFWNELTITPVRNAEGAIGHYIGITRDVTERRTAQAALEKVEARYRLLFDHIRAGVVLHGADTEILYANAVAAELLGIGKADMLGAKNTDSRWIFVREDGSPMPVEEYPVNRAIASGDVIQGMVVGQRRADGEVVWLMCNAHPVFDEDPHATRVVVSFTDVTELKETGIELDRAKMAAEAASLAKAQFLANMSHEIRTPLTAVIGFSGLLEKDESLSDAARLYVNRIADGGKTLLALVNDILDFSNIEANQVYLEPHAFDPVEVVRSTAHLVAAQAAEKGLYLDVVPNDPLPPLVWADSAQLKQILLNLLANAVKFTGEGGVTVGIQHHPGDGSLRVSVTDTGVGVPPDRLQSIFERFFQVDASVNRQYGGSGLGLAISRELARLMGGDIEVRSKVGDGSTFTVAIPAPLATSALETAPLEPARDDLSALEPARILVVDDVAQNRELVRAMLEAVGFDIDEAENGLQAVKAALAKPYDLILMDMQMPGMDGLAATQAIRASLGPNAGRPILALSANVLPDQVAKCLKAGMNDHIPKPINARELIGKIAYWTEPLESDQAA